MAHNVFGNRVMVRRVPAWHALGWVVEDMPSAVEALDTIENGRPMVIDKLPIEIDVPGFGKYNPDNKYAIIRRPTYDDAVPRMFGVVNADYGVLQNVDVARLADMLIDGSKGAWTLDTIGILKYGATIFMSLRGPQFDVNGDDHGMYLGITDQRDGTSAVDFSASLTRMVCWNTVSYALGSAKERVTVRHHADILEEVTWRTEVIARLTNQGESMVNALRALNTIAMDDKKVNKILDELFPLPTAPATIELRSSNKPNLVERGETAEYQYAWRVESVKNARKEVFENYRAMSDNGYGDNGYSLYNAITGWIDHQSGKDTDHGVQVMAQRSISDKMNKFRADAMTLIRGGKIKSGRK